MIPDAPRFTFDDFASGKIPAARREAYALFSSVWGGIVTDPRLMSVPVSDHVVHRGDGVFETLKCAAGAVYNLRAHLERLLHSAEAIALPPVFDAATLEARILQTIRAGGEQDCLIRVLFTRGPGGFGVNPYEAPEPALYIAVYPAAPPFMQAHPEGARAILSAVPLKPPRFAAIKNCNYLPNVLMKKEAVDAGADFAIGIDAEGRLAEGPTENIAVLDRAGNLLTPGAGPVLAGTTLARVMEFAEAFVLEGRLASAGTGLLSRADLADAAEIMMVSTTTHVTAVVRLDGRPVGDGRPGPIARALDERLGRDVFENTALRTPAWG